MKNLQTIVSLAAGCYLLWLSSAPALNNVWFLGAGVFMIIIPWAQKD